MKQTNRQTDDHISVSNHVKTQRNPFDFTSLPSDVKSWNDYEKWLTYENTEFRADKNFEECWGDVDNLKKKFGDVYLLNINYGPVIRLEQGAQRHCFGFDYAIAPSNQVQRRKIKRLADNYRNIGCDGNWTSPKAIKSIAPLIALVESMPHVQSHFS